MLFCSCFPCVCCFNASQPRHFCFYIISCIMQRSIHCSPGPPAGTPPLVSRTETLTLAPKPARAKRQVKRPFSKDSTERSDDSHLHAEEGTGQQGGEDHQARRSHHLTQRGLESERICTAQLQNLKWPWVKSPVPPVNIPIPTKIGSKMGGAPKTPKWDPIGFDTHSQIQIGSRGKGPS